MCLNVRTKWQKWRFAVCLCMYLAKQKVDEQMEQKIFKTENQKCRRGHCILIARRKGRRRNRSANNGRRRCTPCRYGTPQAPVHRPSKGYPHQQGCDCGASDSGTPTPPYTMNVYGAAQWCTARTAVTQDSIHHMDTLSSLFQTNPMCVTW